MWTQHPKSEDMADKLALLACGIFFLIGLLTGVWKYLSILKSPSAEAPRYVAIAHRTSLMYAFAALILMKFAEFSAYSETVNLIAVAIAIYILHGVIGDTDNQFRRPYRIGRFRISPSVFHSMNWLLIVGEIGGFLVLFIGACQTVIRDLK